MYVAAKGGEKAIAEAHSLLARKRRGDESVPVLSLDQVKCQLGLAVDRVMCEGSLYDRELASLAIKQAQGDFVEAIFLLRAYRTTLPRFGFSEPLDTGNMQVQRRISAAFKDLPGGQVLGPTYDYTHRLLDFTLMENEERVEDREEEVAEQEVPENPHSPMTRVADLLRQEELIGMEPHEDPGERIGDLTREPLLLPADRDVRLQNLARADEGFLLSMAYSLQRGFGYDAHPFLGEIRYGEVSVEMVPEELGFPIEIGTIEVTECVMINRFAGTSESPPEFKTGYGLTFGHCERKCMSMAMVDRALRCREFGENADYPAQDEEFMLFHSDNVEASGFVQHLKLPHYVDFQADLNLMRRMRAEYFTSQGKDSKNRGK
ncbi:MAG: carbon-phosphorus lyase complex subunit PhnI [Desulfobacteraceae bacterium]|jgi:alpha-D-ribose 1-methylphosphonate 5-triphosphate synthase subunit PhnI